MAAMFEMLAFISLLCLLLLIERRLVPIVVVDAAAASPSMGLPGCQDKCGGVLIPYPFGIGDKSCFLDDWYEVTCNASSKPGIWRKPFLRKPNLEILHISMGYNDTYITISSPVLSYSPERGNSTGSNITWASANLSGSPFNFSSTRNSLYVVGCDFVVLKHNGGFIQDCTSNCKFLYGFCYLPGDDLDSYSITISYSGYNKSQNDTYAYLSSSGSYWGEGNAPVSLFWTVTGHVKLGEYFCVVQSGNYYSCTCQWPYQGNPYIPNGCKDIKACAKCHGQCIRDNTGKFFCYHNHKTQIILGSSLGGGLLLLLLCAFCFWMYKLIKKRRIRKRKQKFFKRNGGLLLQQQILSGEGTIEKTIIFTSNELEKATDNFNENRVIGQGGQGTVYKGMLSDGKTVAIKKSKVVDESQLEQFINEVVILSQINHRNIVNLLGCCLETDVPFIVYEFISNGNLCELIQDQNEDFPLSWKMRLQIATEVAGAVAYLHSASSTPIFHRDIKSTNILLDEKYRAKVSDFGTSRSIAIEQSHLTTIVQGTFGYLDPEYFQSSQFTDKSDVYSFGVVLVELLTGQKAISLVKSEEERSLATRFILFLEDMRLFDLLDPRVIEEASKEDVIAVANIARRCLSLSGKQRPPMKQVMMELEAIRMSHIPSDDTQDNYIQENKSVVEMETSKYYESSWTHSGLVYQRPFSSDVDSLLFNML